MEQIQRWDYFPSSIYSVDRPDFLESVRQVTDEQLQNKTFDEIYPVVMTDNFFADPRLAEFSKFVGENAWTILKDQGYAMDNMMVTFTEMWTQEHRKHSLMEQHVHGFGSQIVGFYFLDVPEGSSVLNFHDPRAGKVQINLPEQNGSIVTPASNAITFVPKEGMMMFASSWLPHSFGRHSSDKALRFVHFNLTVSLNPNQSVAEVV